MDFLVYSRAGGVEPDRRLTEEHWSYMDRFADGMTARGPTLADDCETWTGSLHIVDLPGIDAAREFVEREPYNRAEAVDALLRDGPVSLDERVDVEIHHWEFGGRR